MSKYLLLLLLLFTTLFSGCNKRVSTSIIEPTMHNDVEIYEAFTDHNIDYTWYSFSGKMKISSEENNFSGKIILRIKKDSIIWSILKKHTVEGIRCQIDSENYTIINRRESSYHSGKTIDLLTKSDFTASFLELQNLIASHIPLIDYANSSYSINPYNQSYQIIIANENLNYSALLSKNNLRLENISFTNSASNVKIDFDNYKTVNDSLVIAHKRTYNITPFDGSSPSTVIIEMKNIEINLPKKTPFKVPPHYKNEYEP